MAAIVGAGSGVGVAGAAEVLVDGVASAIVVQIAQKI